MNSQISSTNQHYEICLTIDSQLRITHATYWSFQNFMYYYINAVQTLETSVS